MAETQLKGTDAPEEAYRRTHQQVVLIPHIRS